MFIITGASGGIGSELFNELLLREKVIGISKKNKIKSDAGGIMVNIDLLEHHEITKLVDKYKNILGTDQITIKPGSLDGAPGDKVNQI